MTRIFADTGGSGEFIIQTTALDLDAYLAEFSEALAEALKLSKDEGDLAAFGILKNAMPIAFKLSGYRADTVNESRTLACGTIDPHKCKVVSSAGR